MNRQDLRFIVFALLLGMLAAPGIAAMSFLIYSPLDGLMP